MPRKMVRKRTQESLDGTKDSRKVVPAESQNSRKLLTIKNPINQAASLWELELLDITPEDFLQLWQSGSDRIGFNLAERAIYDKRRQIARILKEVKLRKSAMSEEE